ncbi:MAG: AraC family transcriptional regulator [Spirochaetes bacterium]|nr:AraC family transcriptional regulator [Spirochaetota bacterium]
MTYFDRIQKAVEFIEKNLTTKITLGDIAQVACFSAFHFHRIFHSLTNQSPMDYIRKRRLALAVEELRESDKSILEIAVNYQFGTHESFTRAFRRFYGMNPGKFRKLQKISLETQSKINIMDTLSLKNYRSIFMEPKIMNNNEFFVIGYELKTSSEEGRNFKEIPVFWEKYFEENLAEKIPGKIKQKELGICCNMDNVTGAFSYVIGYEVNENTKEGDGMVKIKVPAAKYAVFTTPKVPRVDFVKSIQETTKFIYSQWLPQSEYELDSNGYDFELYDERAGGDEDCQMEIHIPVK